MSAETAPPKILIVDDHAANRDTLIALLEGEPFDLLQAESGAEALRLATAELPDLILLDVMMPGMDVFEVCRRLRTQPATAEVPVILVTALDDQASRLAGIEAGADDFISKPFNRAELRARVRTITRLNRYARLHREQAKVQLADRRIREQAALIDLDPDAIIVLDSHHQIHEWNRGAEQLYGWSAAEAVGRSLADVVSTSPDDALAIAAQEARQTGQWRGDLTMRSRDGARLIVESRWTYVADTPPRTLIIDRDVTEKRDHEARWLRAQRLDCLGGLASGIVHDLNNVLSPILMAAELLRSDLSDPDAPRWVEMIHGDAQRCAAMVRQILAFVRGSDAQRGSVQVRHLLADLHRMIAQTFPATIDCQVDSDADLWPVSADLTQLYQVLLNLAVNARDAMPRGGRLRIEARNTTVDAAHTQITPDAAAGPHVMISVADDGEGIPPEVAERIFEPFFTTKPVGSGTGLGLATVQQVVRAHGGFLELRSHPGEGTQFTVYLPAASDSDPSLVSAAPAALPHGRDELVLVADDEAALREITKATLESFGYRVVVAGDGAEAVARGAEHGAGLALMVTDLHMPHLDGLAAIRAIRTLCPQLPVIAMSGSPAEQQAVARSGVDVQAVLTKPLSAAALLVEMDRVLRVQV
jgi:PAS domain S-box-containing protein